MNSISDVDVKLLEQISLRAVQYLEDRHGLTIRDYQIMFKVTEVFLNEMIAFIKVNAVTDDALSVFDQFTIVLDDSGRFESIEISEYIQKTIEVIYKGILDEDRRLKEEDDKFAENMIKNK
jgi:hypothetical protein